MDTLNFSTLSSSEIKILANLLKNIQNQTPPQTLDTIVAAKLLSALQKNKANS